MKILRVIPSIDPKEGGPIAGARNIDSELIKNGHTVEVVCLDEPAAEKIALSYPAKVNLIPGSSGHYRYNSKLINWLKENSGRFDAVIVNGLWQFHSFAVWRALAKSNTPYFVYTHGMLDPWFKKAYPLKHLKKWLYWPWAEYRVLRDAAAVFFTSEEEQRQSRKSFWLYSCNEIITPYGTLPPPTDSEKLKSLFLSNFPELSNKKIILFLSRIHEKKGCDILIEAFAKVFSEKDDYHLVIAGPDQTGWVEQLKDRAKALGISSKITWPGMLQGDMKWGAFYASEAYCLPSHQENFGIAVAEALSCGTPVLISNKVNIWREIEASNSGFIDTDTIEGTVNSLNRLYNTSRDKLDLMKTSALKISQEKFNIGNAAIELIKTITLTKNSKNISRK